MEDTKTTTALKDEERLLEKAGECILAVLTQSSVMMTPYDIGEIKKLIVQQIQGSDSVDVEGLIEELRDEHILLAR